MNSKIALDSCVVIRLIDGQNTASKLRLRLKGKQLQLVLCEKVLDEVKKVRGLAWTRTIELITQILGRKPEVSYARADDVTQAQELSEKYLECHPGDNIILALCMARNYILLTYDRMFLKICDLVGVVAFHPLRVGAI